MSSSRKHTRRQPSKSTSKFCSLMEGTRCAAITAAAVALADAGIPMKDLVAAVAVGKVEGKMAADLSKDEDNFGESDMPLAIAPRNGDVLLFQMDGNASQRKRCRKGSISHTRELNR